MKKIKTFIERFFEAEALALDAMVKPDLDDYNNKLAKMNSFCVEKLHNMFGMIPLTELWDDDLYEEWKYADPINPRYIYKISHYKNEFYDDVYIVYTSPNNPDNIIFLYGESIFVTKIDEELKVVKRYVFGDEMLMKRKFENGLGLKDISFETIGTPIEIERYMPPTHDKDGMEHYLADI